MDGRLAWAAKENSMNHVHTIDRSTFVRQHTRLQRLTYVPEIQLYLAGEITPLWRLTEAALGQHDPPPPFWAFAWAGGLALARYLLDHPWEVAGKAVLDFATGSGLCAIAAMQAGAASVLAADIDAFCEAAVALNAPANGVSVSFTGHDLLDGDPPTVDLILAGDICYEQSLATRTFAWLRAAHIGGTRVLIGDPGRTYLPREALLQLAAYQVPVTRDLEATEVKATGVFTFPDAGSSAREFFTLVPDLA
jgi:predicted nicotinamide N-methyase